MSGGAAGPVKEGVEALATDEEAPRLASNGSHAGMAGSAPAGAKGEDPVDNDKADAAPVDEPEADRIVQVGYRDIAKEFSLLGWTAFGGPAAHIGLFQRVGVQAGGATCLACRRHDPPGASAWASIRAPLRGLAATLLTMPLPCHPLVRCCSGWWTGTTG